MKISTPDYLPKGAQLFEKDTYAAVMPALLIAGLSPVSPAWVMDLRNENPDKDHPAWNTHFDTGFGVAGTETQVFGSAIHGAIQYVFMMPNSPQLREVTDQTPLIDHGVKFDVLKGANIYATQGSTLNVPLTEEQARRHPLWLEAADGDQDRLDEYVGNVFRIGKDKYNLDTMMGFYVTADGVLRPLAIGVGRDNAGSGRFLDDHNARLVGIPEGLEAQLLKHKGKK